MEYANQGAQATPAAQDVGRDLAGLSDAAALERIDRLRLWAREADSAGHTREARGMLSEATRIARHNYVGADVILEYADFLESHGFPEWAAEYRRQHEELASALEDCGGPFDGYEASLRGERAAAAGEPRQRVGDAVAKGLPEAIQPRQAPATAITAQRRSR